MTGLAILADLVLWPFYSTRTWPANCTLIEGRTDRLGSAVDYWWRRPADQPGAFGQSRYRRSPDLTVTIPHPIEVSA